MSLIQLTLLGLLGAPLMGAASCQLLGNKQAALFNAITSLFAFLTMLFAIGLAWLSSQAEIASLSWQWFAIGTQTINLSFDFNEYSRVLLVLVSGIAFLVTVYSIGFLDDDASQPRYFFTLFLFTFSMLGLTLSGNLLQLFVCWELVGLSSYLLIGYYRAKPEAGAAASKSLIMNKIGDVGFLIALMMLWVTAHTFDISALENSHFIQEAKPFISAFILVAILSKSAQFPFYTWLPAAMEGPTPVSALIHSATMVAAGVFLMVRLHFLFTPDVLLIAVIVGATTSLIGALNALRENDLKKLLAWSTLSQLGLMIMVAGNSGFSSSFLHLITHAVFKAGLFLVAGILISQFPLVKLNERLPHKVQSKVLIGAFVLLCLSLMGVPFTAGFVSKEAMIGQMNSMIFLIIFFAINFLTIAYTIRLITFLISGENSNTPLRLRESMLIPVLILAIGCLSFFYSMGPLVDFQSDPSQWIVIISIIWVLGWIAILFPIARKGRLNSVGKLIPVIPFDRWLNAAFLSPTVMLANLSNKSDQQIDRGIHLIVYLKFSFALLTAWFDRAIVDGVAHTGWWSIGLVGKAVRKLVSGKIQSYLWWTLLAVIILLIWAK
jgi:NADH-quinone oxidoreductase subunit L